MKTFAIAKHEGSFRSRILTVLFAMFIAAVVAASTCLHPGLAWAGNDGTDDMMRVNDFSDVLKAEDQSYLSKKVKAMEPQLKFDIVVNLSTKPGTAVYAQGFFAKNNFGYGKAEDGMILNYNTETGDCAVYVHGTGSVIFSDSDIAGLEKAFKKTAKKDITQAVYDFLANASIKAGAYQGEDVSGQWPQMTVTEKAPEPKASKDKDSDKDAAEGKGDSDAKDEGKDENSDIKVLGSNERGPKHTTAELDWYPKDPTKFKEFHNPDAPRVVDKADLLTDDEEAELLAKIKDMEGRLDMDFVLYTDMSSYGLSRGQFAADFYAFNGYGRGDDFKGVVYFVCMEPGNRGFWTAACGSAQEYMTEENVNHMDDETYDYFKSGDYAKAINVQFDNLDILYTNGEFPFDWAALFAGIAAALFFALIFGVIMGLKDLSGLKKKMKTVARARYAREYADSPVFSVRTDTLIDHTITRTKHVDHDSDSGSSSGGSSSYSSGYHSSGGSSSHTFSGGGRSF